MSAVFSGWPPYRTETSLQSLKTMKHESKVLYFASSCCLLNDEPEQSNTDQIRNCKLNSTQLNLIN